MADIARRERDSAPSAPTPGATRADRAWAWTGAIVAASVSVAVNIAHAAPRSWGFAAFAAVLPIMVLISAEQMARRLLGRATWAVMLTSGLCAYSLSFWHAVLLLRSWGEPWPLQVTGAIAVDVLAVGSVVALYMTGRDQRSAEPSDPADRSAPPPDGRDTVADDAPAVRPYASTLPLVAPPVSDVRPVVLASSLSGDVRLMADVRPARPASVRTGEVNGRPVASVRTGEASGRPVASVRTLDEPVSDPDADAWARWEADGRPSDWRALGEALGCSPEAARKRAGRRSRPDGVDA